MRTTLNLDQRAAVAARFATTPVTELGLVRLSLNPAVRGQQIAPSAALASLGSLRADSRLPPAPKMPAT